MSYFSNFKKKISHEARVLKRSFRKVSFKWKEIAIVLGALFFVFAAAVAIWLSTLTIPNLDSFANRKVSQSTKIYDSTGTILLYDFNTGQKRTTVDSSEIAASIKKATVAIEDEHFYEHGGIDVTSIFRAILADFTSFGYAQGGSTITQQLVKNSLLTTDQKISRKLKEWVLAIKLEKVMTKDQILTLYLNESPYGGQIYGVEEASETYFGKHASELDNAQGAYLASLLKAPTHYSPYGSNRAELDSRQHLVLQKMLDNKFITQDEYAAALAENVTFEPQATGGIRAPHFVNFVIDELSKKYDADTLAGGGMRVITTLDFGLETTAEALVKQYALSNEVKFKASNAALVAIDPKTGGILAMVGSRDYFDPKIDGNFNVATAERQPGSTFKPIVYATAFEQGYQPETVVFDVPTEFSTNCAPDSTPLTPGASCYHPVDFDGVFLGPIDLRHALGESRNIPAIKMLYLAGIDDSLKTARDLGITSLGAGAKQYGLTLVLGGGEVSPLELTSAYGTFADNGTHMPYEAIQRVEDHTGKIIDTFQSQGVSALPPQIAKKMNNVLSDYSAKDPNEFLHFPNQDVAAKTGTTNDFRDAWIMGYTPNIAVGVWTGNNDNSAMVKQVAGYIAAPLWHAFMVEALKTRPVESFDEPDPEDLSSMKPQLIGSYRSGPAYVIDRVSGQLATPATPIADRKELFTGDIHSILFSVNKNDPTGAPPANPSSDPQFSHWEYGIQQWLLAHPEVNTPSPQPPAGSDTVHTQANGPKVSFIDPKAAPAYAPSDRITIHISHTEAFPIVRIDYFVNDSFIGSAQSEPWSVSFVPSGLSNIQAVNTLRAVATDSVGNRGEASMQFQVSGQ